MISSINKILDNKVIIPINKNVNDSFLLFTEDAPDSDIKKLKITGIPDNSCAFTLDYASKDPQFTRLSYYFNSANGDGINKSCDLVIFTIGEINEINEMKEYSVNILVADIKSKTVPNSVNVQIENSILFIQYIISLIQNYYKIVVKPNFIKVVISTKCQKKTIGTNSKDIKIKSISKFHDKVRGICEITFPRLVSG